MRTFRFLAYLTYLATYSYTLQVTPVTWGCLQMQNTGPISPKMAQFPLSEGLYTTFGNTEFWSFLRFLGCKNGVYFQRVNFRG